MDVARPVQHGDYVVVNYAGVCEGKSIREVAPTAQGLSEKKNFWVHVEEGTLIPGFASQLIGAQAGEKRVVTVGFPADFVEQPLAGRQGVYDVEVVQVKQRVRPDLNDEFAKSYRAESEEKLREGVRTDLQRELDHKQNVSVRNQLVRQLLDRVQFELPESFVQQETRNVVFDIVKENQRRGVTTDTIEQQKDQIYTVASNSAKDRVKAGFLLSRIAEKEGITASQDEITRRILFLAEQYQIKPEKMVKQLQERDGIAEIHEQIITSKVLDFLGLHAHVHEVPADSAPGT